MFGLVIISGRFGGGGCFIFFKPLHLRPYAKDISPPYPKLKKWLSAAILMRFL